MPETTQPTPIDTAARRIGIYGAIKLKYNRYIGLDSSPLEDLKDLEFFYTRKRRSRQVYYVQNPNAYSMPHLYNVIQELGDGSWFLERKERRMYINLGGKVYEFDAVRPIFDLITNGGGDIPSYPYWDPYWDR